MQFLTTPTDTIAVIDGTLPKLHEWERIAKDQVLVNVLSLPGKSASLDHLLPFAEYISRLAVNSASCTDLSGIEAFSGLKSLSVGGVVSRAPRASSLVSLQFFGGDPLSMPGVISLPTIVELKIKWHPAIVDDVSESTSNLTLMEASRLTDLSGFARLRNLNSLTIHGSKRVGLGELRQIASLSHLELNMIRSVVETSSVLDAPVLSSLIFENCSHVEQSEALQAFLGVVRVIGRNPFTEDFQRAVGANWSFPLGRLR